MKKTKIICSIGPASNCVNVMETMHKNGMNVVRINCSHATKEEKETVTNSVKEVCKLTGGNIEILYDTKGPEFRNGMLENGQINLVEGNTIKIVKETVLGNEERFSVNHPNALDSLKIGSVVFLQNGLMKIEVISIDNDENGNRTGVTCKIINGGILGNKKSLCVPGIHLNIPFISDSDKEDLIYACTHDCDYLALSFVNCKEDVLEVRDLLKEFGRDDIKIMSKIESETGYLNFDEILDVSDEIMIGRGDLGDEIAAGKLAVYQKNMVKKCKLAGKKVAVATEMMESMITKPRPTRAEVLDVANAVLDGADYVMLSGETTIGKYPREVVGFMKDICVEVEKFMEN